MRPFNKFMMASLLIGGCAIDSSGTAMFPPSDAAFVDDVKSDHAEGDGETGGQGGSAGNSGSAGTPSDGGPAGEGGVAGDAADAGVDADVDADADADAEADADATVDADSDVVLPDVTADATDADAEDVEASVDAMDASDAETGDEPLPPDCLTTGVRVRMDAINGKTIVQANAALGDPSSFTQGACTAADDRDPSPSSFECCLSTSPSGVVKVWLDFVFSDTSHACTSTASGCSPLTQYTIWFDGNQVQQLYISHNYLPNCQDPGCQWFIYTGP